MLPVRWNVTVCVSLWVGRSCFGFGLLPAFGLMGGSVPFVFTEFSGLVPGY